MTCPHCKSKEVRFVSTRKIWECKHCVKKQFSARVGTIFEDSPLPLDKWFVALWLLVNAKNGISSYEIHRSLGVTQKTGWFMLQRLRLAVQNGSVKKMNGVCEADETYIGAKARYMPNTGAPALATPESRKQPCKVSCNAGRQGKRLV